MAFASRFMDAVGDGTGVIDMSVDGSVTPIEFRITAGPKQELHMNRLIITLHDGGPFNSGGYGRGVALTNGIRILVREKGGAETEFTTQHPIKTNVDWDAYCFDSHTNPYQLGDEVLKARYTMTKDTNGETTKLRPGDSLVVIVADDLSYLTHHHIRVGMTSHVLTI